jgi:hypothetical protein
VDEDFLEPGDAGGLEDEERRDDVAEEPAKDALERADDAPGIEGPERLGLTPPD